MTENNQHSKINEIIDMCLDEINLINSDALSDNGQHFSPKIPIDDLDLDDLGMNLSCVYDEVQTGVTIIIDFHINVEKKRVNKMFRLMNLMNLQLLDIGTMSFIPQTGIVRMAAQIPVAGEDLEQHQLREYLNRLLSLTVKSSIHIIPFASNSSSPEKAMTDLVISLTQKQFQTNMPINNQTNILH